MENKKLIKILLKDMGELEELISDIKSNGGFNALEMEFVHTRAKGIFQLMQMLNYQDGSVSDDNNKRNNLKESESEQKAEISITQQVMEEKPEPEKELFEEEPEVEKEQVNILISAEVKEETAQEPELVESAVVQVEEKQDEVVLEEETEKPEIASRLGDSFLKGRSVNDLITEHVNLESKLSNLPVSNLQSAIGINDRFQYIRELFDGDNQKFQDTVKAIDSMHNLNEAAEYLRNNFKWKKNETSLKFVNLIKRRFLNE